MDTFQTFLADCDEKFGLMNGASKKAFDLNGNPINTIHDLNMNEIYYISEVRYSFVKFIRESHLTHKILSLQ